MKTTSKVFACFLLSAVLGLAQWAASPTTTYPALNTYLDMRAVGATGTSAPNSCTTGKDFFTTTGGGMFWCVAGAYVRVGAYLSFTPLNPANNLSDVGSVSTARTNLGLGSAATQSSSAFEPAIAGGSTAQYVRGDKTLGTFATAAQSAMSGLFESPLTFGSGLTRSGNSITCTGCGGVSVPGTAGQAQTGNGSGGFGTPLTIGGPNGLAQFDSNGNLPVGDGTHAGGDIFQEVTANGNNFVWLGALDDFSATYGMALPSSAPTPSTAYNITFGSAVTKTINNVSTSVYPMSFTPAATGPSYYSAFGPQTTLSQDGTAKALWTFSNVPALAAQSCYTFKGNIGTASAAFLVEIWVGSTLVDTVSEPGGFTAGYTFQFERMYCNNVGTQATQSVVQVDMRYQSDLPYNDATNANGTWATTASPARSGTAYKAATSVDWSTSHTITVKTTGASGSVTGNWFKVN